MVITLQLYTKYVKDCMMHIKLRKEAKPIVTDEVFHCIQYLFYYCCSCKQEF